MQITGNMILNITQTLVTSYSVVKNYHTAKQTCLRRDYHQLVARTQKAMKERRDDIVKNETENLKEILNTLTTVKPQVIPIDETSDMPHHIYSDFSPRRYILRCLRTNGDILVFQSLP